MFPTRCYVREKWQHWPWCHIMFFVPIWFLWLCLPSQPRFWSSHIFCVFFVQLIHFQKRYMFPVCTITRIHRIQRVGFFVTALIGLLVSETKPGMSQYKLRHTEIASVQIVPRCGWCGTFAQQCRFALPQASTGTCLPRDLWDEIWSKGYDLGG